MQGPRIDLKANSESQSVCIFPGGREIKLDSFRGYLASSIMIELSIATGGMRVDGRGTFVRYSSDA
jgi:hypothetical protein